MRLTELIAKLQRLSPSATVELHNGKAWVKCGEASYRPLDEYARESQTLSRCGKNVTPVAFRL